MNSLFSYISIAALIAIIPGPDTMLLVKNTLSYGRKAGRYTVLGVAAGLSIWTILAILGLSIIIAKSTILFSIIKYLGAAYLVFLGIKNFFAKSTFSLDDLVEVSSLDNSVKNQSKSHNKNSFMQAFLTNTLNPKTILVYVTIMPQFINLEGNVNQQLIVLALILTLIVVIWDLFIVGLINYLEKWLNNFKFQKLFQKSAGMILIAFGIKTAV